MTLTTVLAYCGSTLASIAMLPQIIRIIKIKDAHALSYTFLILRTFAFLFMCSALISAGQIKAASSYIILLTANVILITLKHYYTNTYPKKHPFIELERSGARLDNEILD